MASTNPHIPIVPQYIIRTPHQPFAGGPLQAAVAEAARYHDRPDAAPGGERRADHGAARYCRTSLLSLNSSTSVFGLLLCFCPGYHRCILLTPLPSSHRRSTPTLLTPLSYLLTLPPLSLTSLPPSPAVCRRAGRLRPPPQGAGGEARREDGPADQVPAHLHGGQRHLAQQERRAAQGAGETQ
jgi:hypothetical protein